MRRRMLLLTSAVIAVLAISATIAVASGGSDELTGPDAERAIVAALVATGGGTANEVERDDEGGGAFEVEVTRPDGTTVDVRLDGAFEVIAIEGEGTEGAEGAEDADGTEPDDTDNTQEPESDDGEG